MQDEAVRFADLLRSETYTDTSLSQLRSMVHILVVTTLQLRIPTTPDIYIISSHISSIYINSGTQLQKKKKKKNKKKKKKYNMYKYTKTHVIKGLCAKIKENK